MFSGILIITTIIAWYIRGRDLPEKWDKIFNKTTCAILVGVACLPLADPVTALIVAVGLRVAMAWGITDWTLDGVIGDKTAILQMGLRSISFAIIFAGVAFWQQDATDIIWWLPLTTFGLIQYLTSYIPVDTDKRTKIWDAAFGLVLGICLAGVI